LTSRNGLNEVDRVLQFRGGAGITMVAANLLVNMDNMTNLLCWSGMHFLRFSLGKKIRGFMR
jgi:hypothetical protein